MAGKKPRDLGSGIILLKRSPVVGLECLSSSIVRDAQRNSSILLSRSEPADFPCHTRIGTYRRDLAYAVAETECYRN